MRDTIFNMRQDIALEMKEKHKLNIEDFILIRKIGDFSLSDDTIEIIKDGKAYHWISYETIQKDFPLLYPTVEAIKKRVHRMTKKGLLVSKAHIVKRGDLNKSEFNTPGTFSILRLEKEAKKLFNSKVVLPPGQNGAPLEPNCPDPQDNLGRPLGQNGVNKELLEKNPKKRTPKKEVVAKKKGSTAAPEDTFFKNLKDLLSKASIKNQNSNTLKNIKEFSNGDLEEVKKVIEFIKLKNKNMNSKVLVAILRDKDHLIVEPVELKKVTRKEKINFMVNKLGEIEINDLREKVKEQTFKGEEGCFVNTELENVLCKRFNKYISDGGTYA
ncbi:hypothetical protein [Psychrilyobacter atlanticus]|uniref:hypothetical protein n=1 Tax=Psychrilyobacter atlanticus TaxID=271091 RepID=UPI0003FD5D93|nr:hypothetical protein [Psychrilyobacter atlanticus]